MAKDIPPKSSETHNAVPNVVFGNALPPKEAKAQKMAELGNDHNYAMSELVSTPFSKTAQVTSDVNTIYTNPMWFSPLHTPQSWQVASKRREIYQWSFIKNPNFGPCDVVLYGESIPEDIECIYKTITSETLSHEEKEVFVQTGSGKKGYVDQATKRWVHKKACSIKARGVYEPITVTHDHKCIVIRNEDVKCKYHKKKNCTPGCNSYTCNRAKCSASKNRDYIVSKCNADEVKKGDYFLVPFNTDVEPSIITNIDQARFAGHLASDGWVRFNKETSGYNCAICMNTQEREFVLPTYDKVLESFGVDPQSMQESISDSGNLITKRTATIRVADYAHQLVLGKGITKRYTKEVMLLNPELQLEVLGAYIQSDGSFDKEKETIEITSYSKYLAYQLLTICYRCGILASGNKQPISKSKGTFKTKSEFRYIISIPTSNNSKIAKFCPGKLPTYIKRTRFQSKRFFWKNYVVTPVTSIKTFDYEGDVYDIRVPGEYTLTANGIAIHNCRFFYECFTADNKVLMADGTEKPISEINPDDLIISGDGSSRKVLTVFKRKLKSDDVIIDIVAENKKLRCTINHVIPRINSSDSPAWKNKLVWDSADTLQPGDELLGVKENERFKVLYIQKVENTSEIDFVYDLEIDQIHSYFVGKCMVHNSEPKVAAGIDFYCFDPFMQILLENGTQIAISSIKAGHSIVRCHDGTTNKVARVFEREVVNEEMLYIQIEGFASVKTTKGHKLLTPIDGKNEFVQAQELKVGDALLTPFEDNVYIQRKILSIEKYNYTGTLYDLEIENVHSYVVNGIACSNSQFPVNGLKLVWPHSTGQKKLLHFYEEEVKRLNLMTILKQISSEYFMLGDVFIHTDISCPSCKGAHINPVTGEVCNHAGGTISRIKVLNPDWIEVTDTIFADEPKIMMIPDEQIVRICTTRQPLDIYQRLPDRLKQLVLSRKPIPLSNRVVSHLKHQPVPYSIYGTSLIRRLFTTLAYKTKIMTANWIVAERLIIPIRVVKIGSDNRPATSADIAEVNQMLAAAANDPNLTLCTHHNFEFDFVGASGKILQLGQELEHIDKELLDGLMLNQALLNGEMCLTPDHQVLTSTGYKNINEVTKEDSICVWDSRGDVFIYEKPEELIQYHDVEEIYELYSGDKKIMRCTGKHKLVLKSDLTAAKCYRFAAEELYSFLERNRNLPARMLLRDGSYIGITRMERVPYSGSVYCFKTSTGYFVAKFDDIEFVSSNSSYQSAQVGVEVLIRRVEAWRNMLAEWVEEKIFKPIAQMKGLIDKESSEEYGQKVWLYPTIKWNDLNLKDKTSWYQLLMQLHDKQVISTQTLCEELDLQYDQEVERLRYEIANAGPMGAQLGGAGGGMGGGMMGGGGGGGGISAPGGGAAAPGPGGDMGGMGGPGGAPGGDMGGGMGGGGAPGVTAAGQPMKILKRSKAKALAEREEPMQYGQVRFTRIEQEFRHMLDNIYGSLNLNMPYYFQYQVQNPAGGHNYMIDFAFPQIKLGAEVDGRAWHSNPEQIKHDRERDYNLAMRGWTIIRFDDKTIDNKPEAVQQTVVGYLKKLSSKGTKKKASIKDSDGEASYLTVYADKVIDVYNDQLPQEMIDIFEEDQ